jgi:hypothetical protein
MQRSAALPCLLPYLCFLKLGMSTKGRTNMYAFWCLSFSFRKSRALREQRSIVRRGRLGWRQHQSRHMSWQRKLCKTWARTRDWLATIKMMPCVWVVVATCWHHVLVVGRLALLHPMVLNAAIYRHCTANMLIILHQRPLSQLSRFLSTIEIYRDI